MKITDDELCLTKDERSKVCCYLRDLANKIEECDADGNGEINLLKPQALPLAPLAPWIIRGIIVVVVRAATIQDAH